MKTKRQVQKENTRQKILNTAYELYSKRGFAVNTAEIAKEAGISHGTVFSHFSSLSELLESLIETFGTAISREIHDQAETAVSVEELLKIHLNILIRQEDFYLRLITERSLLPDEVQYTFADTQSTIAHHFSRVFEKEIKDGTVKDIPVHLLFNTWMGMIHYYLCNKDFFSPEGPVLKRYEEELETTFLKLIR